MLKKLWKKEKGFTLVELLVVVAIIGILVGIAIPVFSNINQRAANSAHEANERILKSAGMMAFVTHGSSLIYGAYIYTVDHQLTADSAHTMAAFLEDWPELPSPIPNDESNGPEDAAVGKVYQLTIGEDGSTTVTMR